MKNLFLAGAIIFGALSVVSNLSVFAGNANAESKMFLSPAVTEVDPGKRITIDILTNSDSNFNTAQVDVEYNAEALELVSATATDVLPNVAYSKNLPGELSFSLYKINSAEGADNLSLLKMTFEGIKGEATVKLLESSKILEAGEILAIGGAEASITVTAVDDTNTGTDNTTDENDGNQSEDNNTEDEVVDDSNSEEDENNNNDRTDDEQCNCDDNTADKDDQTSTEDEEAKDETDSQDEINSGSGVVITNNVETEGDSTNDDSSNNENGFGDSADQGETNNDVNSDGKGQETETLPNTGIGSLAPMAAMACVLGYAINIVRLKFNL